MESKIKAKKNEKEDETNRILDNIEEKQMILAKLQRYSSGNVDEEDDLGLSKMDTDKSKNFRVKIINKGGTTIITQ